MSVLFTITKVGTLRAMAKPRCSFVVPTKHNFQQCKQILITARKHNNSWLHSVVRESFLNYQLLSQKVKLS